MNDCDKLIIIAIIGIKNADHERINITAERIIDNFDDHFDDTCKVLLTFDSDKEYSIDYKTLNQEKIEPERLQELIKKSDEFIKEIKNLKFK
jgi:hypothetical protein